MKAKNPWMFLYLPLLTALVSCASAPPSSQELSNAYYGQPVTQEYAEVAAKAYFDRVLKDPYTAKYEWGAVAKGWVQDPPVYGGDVHTGYRMEVSVNAKNSLGGYVGRKRYVFLFLDGAIKALYGQKTSGLLLKIR